MKASALSYATAVIAGDSAFALDIPVTAEAELVKGKKVSGVKDKLALAAVKNTLKKFKEKRGVKIKVDSNVPAGLGESEAAAVACVLAAAGAVARGRGRVCELKIDKYYKRQFLEVDGRVVGNQELLNLCWVKGLSFARVAAAFHGGFAVTQELGVLRRGEMEDYPAVAWPQKSKAAAGGFKAETQLAWSQALAGNLYQAMKLNAGLVAGKEAATVLDSGAFTVSASEGALVGLFKDEGKAVKAAKKLKGKKIIARTASEPARVEGKPARIYRTKEFMELEGAGGFKLL